MSPNETTEGSSSPLQKPDEVVKRPRVFVVDDEPLLGQTLQLALDETCDVTLETSGESARRRLLSGEAYDVVLCDLGLPDLSGMEVYRAVARERPELVRAFVLITGGAVTAEARAFMEQHTGPLLQKPFTVTQVERLVSSLARPRS
jgi:DNA-binding NtrC family response regulator